MYTYGINIYRWNSVVMGSNPTNANILQLLCYMSMSIYILLFNLLRTNLNKKCKNAYVLRIVTR